jgi:hypothetical protein
MRHKWLAAGFLTALGVFAWVTPSRAGDTVRLKLTDETPILNLVDHGVGADTIQTRWGGWGGWGGRGFYGWRGFYGGWRGFYRPYWGFYRPYWGFYRPWGYGLGYGLGWGYGGLGYGGFYPSYGFGGYYGCSGLSGNVYTLSVPATSLTPPNGTPAPYSQQSPAPTPRGDGTYPYDGGPNAPEVAPAPTKVPQRTVPLEGRSVSLPKAKGKWAYPAYGEIARRTFSVPDRTLLTKATPKKAGSR